MKTSLTLLSLSRPLTNTFQFVSSSITCRSPPWRDSGIVWLLLHSQAQGGGWHGKPSPSTHGANGIRCQLGEGREIRVISSSATELASDFPHDSRTVSVSFPGAVVTYSDRAAQGRKVCLGKRRSPSLMKGSHSCEMETDCHTAAFVRGWCSAGMLPTGAAEWPRVRNHRGTL